MENESSGTKLTVKRGSYNESVAVSENQTRQPLSSDDYQVTLQTITIGLLRAPLVLAGMLLGRRTLQPEGAVNQVSSR